MSVSRNKSPAACLEMCSSLDTLLANMTRWGRIPQVAIASIRADLPVFIPAVVDGSYSSSLLLLLLLLPDVLLLPGLSSHR